MRRAPAILTLLCLACATAAAEEIPIGGRVLGPDGNPLAEAEIRLLPTVDAHTTVRAWIDDVEIEPAAMGKTNAEGRFRLSAPGAGLWSVRVEASGLVAMVADLHPLVAPIELQDVELLADVGMKVRVLSDTGEPVPDALVLLSVQPQPWRFLLSDWRFAPGRGRTDAEGKVTLPHVEKESAALAVTANGFAYHERRGRRGTAATVKLSRGVAGRFEVRGADGKPVAGVVALPPQTNIPIGETNDDGRLILQLPANRSASELNLVAGDGRRLESRVLPSSAGDEKPQILTLPDRMLVVGRLIDADSRAPIGGAVVWDASRPGTAHTTDRAGGFVLGGPPQRNLQISTAAAGYLKPGSVPFLIEAAARPGPTLALRPAAAVEGRVTDGEGQAVAGADVELRVKAVAGRGRRRGVRFDQPTNRTDERGRYRLGGADPDLSYLVRARAEGFAPAEQPVGDLVARRAKSGVDVTLTTGKAVVGSFVDAEEEPIAGVSVRLQAEIPQRPGAFVSAIVDAANPYTAESNQDGRFRIDGIPAGKFTGEARRSGFARHELSTVELSGEADGPIDLGQIVLEPGERIQGFVTDADGAPLEDVAVTVREGGSARRMLRRLSSMGEPDATSEPSGWFSVEDLAAGNKYNLSLRRQGYVREAVSGVEAPRAEPLEVVLRPASTVSGTVVDGKGKPVAGARVELSRLPNLALGGRRFARGFRAAQQTTDDLGRFVFEDQEPARIRLSAVATGFREAELEGLEIPTGEDLDDLELQLSPGAIVEGTVLAPDGRPAINADVRQVTEEAIFGGGGGASTDADGNYRIVGLTPGELSIEATHPDYPRVVRDVEAGEGNNRLDLRFEGGHEISGRVTGTTGEPIRDARVRLVQAGRSWGGPQSLSLGDGSFSIAGVQDGDYQLRASAEGYADSGEGPSIHVEGQAVVGVELQLDGGATVSGRILGLAPERYSDVSVRLSGDRQAWRFGGAGVDPQGEYRLENVGAGSYSIIAALDVSGRQAREQVTVEQGVPELRVDLQFDPGIKLSGQALQGETPVGGASISANGIDIARGGRTETDHEGRFSLEGLEPGRYRVALQDWRSGLSHEETVDLRADRDVILRVPTARANGRVVDGTDREPLSGVTVSLERESQGGAGRPLRFTAVTDLEGRFEVANLADGEWRLSATKQGYAAVTQPVFVQFDSGTEDLQISMDATEGMTLEARLAAGGVPNELRVAVLDAAGAPIVTGTFSTGEGGKVRLSSVPPGAWELIVSAAGAATTSLEAQAPGVLIPVLLPAASRLRVSVPKLADSNTIATLSLRSDTGRPFRSLSWSGQPQSEWRMAGGSMELNSLPPGNWSVLVVTADGRTWQGSSRTTANNVTELRLE